MTQEPSPAIARLQVTFPLFSSLSILEFLQMDAGPWACRLCGADSTGVVRSKPLVGFRGASDVERGSGFALKNVNEISHQESVFRVQIGPGPIKRDAIDHSTTPPNLNDAGAISCHSQTSSNVPSFQQFVDLGIPPNGCGSMGVQTLWSARGQRCGRPVAGQVRRSCLYKNHQWYCFEEHKQNIALKTGFSRADRPRADQTRRNRPLYHPSNEEKSARGLRQRGAKYRCCIPALAGFLRPQSIASDTITLAQWLLECNRKRRRC